MFVALLPLYCFCIRIRYKAMKDAIDINNKDSIRKEIILSVVSLLIILALIYISFIVL